MYEEFYGFKELPFNVTPDPRFLYRSTSHRDALAYITYGVFQKKGFIAVTGEVGARLRAHWAPEAIVEIMGVVALFGYLNRWNDSMGSALEDLPASKGEARLAGATGWSLGKHR